MRHKHTAQDVHSAFLTSRESLSSVGQDMFAHIPEKWEDLTEEQKAAFSQMAWKLNMIGSEFELEGVTNDG